MRNSDLGHLPRLDLTRCVPLPRRRPMAEGGGACAQEEAHGFANIFSLNSNNMLDQLPKLHPASDSSDSEASDSDAEVDSNSDDGQHTTGGECSFSEYRGHHTPPGHRKSLTQYGRSPRPYVAHMNEESWAKTGAAMGCVEEDCDSYKLYHHDAATEWFEIVNKLASQQAPPTTKVCHAALHRHFPHMTAMLCTYRCSFFSCAPFRQEEPAGQGPSLDGAAADPAAGSHPPNTSSNPSRPRLLPRPVGAVPDVGHAVLEFMARASSVEDLEQCMRAQQDRDGTSTIIWVGRNREKGVTKSSFWVCKADVLAFARSLSSSGQASETDLQAAMRGPRQFTKFLQFLNRHSNDVCGWMAQMQHDKEASLIMKVITVPATICKDKIS
jgi:hypothetical protein